ncbi:hypothetical protein JCM3765_007761 [Sporobolomyces pararoseus]
MASSRQVAVAILVIPSSSKPQFLVVSSRKHANRFVLPKGGIEQGETGQEAALREAWEEGGLITKTATHLTHLLTISDPSPHILSPTSDPASPSFVASAKYHFELFSLPEESATLDEKSGGSLAREWPESKERSRKMVHGWEELRKTVSWGRRSELMQQAVEQAELYLEGRKSEL